MVDPKNREHLDGVEVLSRTIHHQTDRKAPPTEDLLPAPINQLIRGIGTTIRQRLNYPCTSTPSQKGSKQA